MNNPSSDWPSQKRFIYKYLDWDKVEGRLQKFRYIAEFFPIEQLRASFSNPPYYCHYLAWRLGTWLGEYQFDFLDRLLNLCSHFPGWDSTRVPKSGSFENYFSFIWELQVAAYFHNQNNGVIKWLKKGPEFVVNEGPDQYFVECTTYQKSFGIELFIKELLGFICPEITVTHIPFIKFSFPKGNAVDDFLNGFFSPYLDSQYVKFYLRQSPYCSPIKIPSPTHTKNFFTIIENTKSCKKNARFENRLSSTGDPEKFLTIAINEVLHSKEDSNDLKFFRPNLLFINYLLGTDWQIANSIRKMPSIEKGDSFDNIWVTACGIDSIPINEKRISLKNITNNQQE